MNNEKTLTLGSLFDGSGGFPLGGIIAGITPVWASEIEPFAVRVTTKRFPFMKHYGDIGKMVGANLEPVDIITFGSPCQDMSVAGKREGIQDGKRSSLFFQAIRIIKEMRESTHGEYPKYIVWENVPGALSSGKPNGADFQSVLTEICRICDANADVPLADKWQNAGEIVGDGYSVAWRILDAQYRGVPQRRKRIYLVADFTGGRAGSILFESEGLSGYSAEGFRTWQRTAGNLADRAGAAGTFFLNTQGHSSVDITFEKTNALVSQAHGNEPCVVESDGFCTEDSEHSRSIGYEKEVSPTLRVAYGIGRDAFNQGQNAQFMPSVDEEVQPTLVAKGPGAVAGAFGFDPQRKAEATGFEEGTSATFVNGTNPGYQNGVVDNAYIVRRLTPTECVRLQGFPDWWCRNLETENPTEEDIAYWRGIFDTFHNAMNTGVKSKTDNQIIKWLKNPYTAAAEYKLWGNGVALPCVFFVLSGIVWANGKENMEVLTNAENH